MLDMWAARTCATADAWKVDTETTADRKARAVLKVPGEANRGEDTSS